MSIEKLSECIFCQKLTTEKATLENIEKEEKEITLVISEPKYKLTLDIEATKKLGFSESPEL